ncbi:MAG: hypothetical protein AB1775_06300 [Bacteroidota bacterium]
MFDISPETKEKIIIGLFIAIVSGIIIHLIVKRWNKSNIRYHEYLRASKEFRDAFMPALDELNPIEDIKSGYTIDIFSFNITVRHFEKQRLAVNTFAQYLSPWNRKKLMKAWQEYAYPYEKKFPGDFDEVGFDYKTVNPADEPEIRERMRKRINKIISFGKY